MKHEKNIETRLEQLARAIGSDESFINSVMSRLETSSDTVQKPTPTFVRRLIMKPFTKFAAAAILIIAVLIGMNHFGISIDGTSVAFAEVLDHINSVSYTFDLTTFAKMNASHTAQAMILEPGKMRVDTTVGLNKVSTIIDVAEGKSMILFHQFKTAQIQDIPTIIKDYGVESFLFLCTESIQNLWGIQDGTEERSGKREINGYTAIGFNVTQEGQYFHSRTTIWADVKTAMPLLVEMTMAPLGDSSESIAFTMNNFDLDVQLDEDLFSLKIPSGYTLAYQYDLDELDKKIESSDQSKKIVQALESWSEGKNAQAVETLLGIDWTQPITFSGKPYLFCMTEKELVSLKPEDQQKVMTDVLTLSNSIRNITNELLSLGQTAMSVQEYNKAEHYFRTALQFGRLLTCDPDTILIGRLVGIAANIITLDEMIILYTKTDQQEKLQAAQIERQDIEIEQDIIRNKAGGM